MCVGKWDKTFWWILDTNPNYFSERDQSCGNVRLDYTVHKWESPSPASPSVATTNEDEKEDEHSFGLRPSQVKSFQVVLYGIQSSPKSNSTKSWKKINQKKSWNIFWWFLGWWGRSLHSQRLDYCTRRCILSKTGYLPEENTRHSGPFFRQNWNHRWGKKVLSKKWRLFSSHIFRTKKLWHFRKNITISRKNW